MINNINGSPLRNLASARLDTSVKPTTNGAHNDKQIPAATGALSGAIAHMAQQGAPLDMDKIMSVRNAIADGQYPVDPAKIAEKIIDFDKIVSDFS